MNTKTTIIAIILLFLINLIFTSLSYTSLPDQMASHWDLSGNVNGYMDKNLVILIFPGLAVALLILFLVIPRIDPKAENIKCFQNTFNTFIFGFIFYLLYINSITLLSNLGYKINVIQLLIPGMSGLVYLIGLLVEKSKPNYTIGIRTPWTLANSEVWYKTHKLGSKLYKLIAIFTLVGLACPSIGLIIFLFATIGVSIFLGIYSYLIYRKER